MHCFKSESETRDEAYALVGEDGRDSFGREALDTLIKLVEAPRWLSFVCFGFGDAGRGFLSLRLFKLIAVALCPCDIQTCALIQKGS